ncbi:MAG: KamA family protein [Bacteroidales bacterium]|nr:KamA family protein [Bacteroidales bacterium]
MYLENLTKSTNSVSKHGIPDIFFEENPRVKEIFTHALTLEKALAKLRAWVLTFISSHNHAQAFLNFEEQGREAYESLTWQDFAAIRIIDYIDNTGRRFEDLNLNGKIVTNNPFKPMWQAVKTRHYDENHAYYFDMLYLFRQLSGKLKMLNPSIENINEWMSRHPSGLDQKIIRQREENKKRILKIIIKNIDAGNIKSEKYFFHPEMDTNQKYELALSWWNTSHFHLKFAIRSPELLNKMLDYSLDEKTMTLLEKAKNKGIPLFVNPYYLSLLDIHHRDHLQKTDQSLRDYIFASKNLIDEFGNIVAWEMEDSVEVGKPNAAGWILPSKHNIHRRYPEVAILIPDTVGRACGGLCVSCQRMYDFQRGRLNFDLEKLKPREKWIDQLRRLLKYYENDSQLRDILITGGDSLMSSDKSIRTILDEVYDMAGRKIEANKNRPDGKKYAEMIRVRLGTRLPVYLPQRITDSLIEILSEFKAKASAIGFEQFVVQCHFESAMEITPEVKTAISKIFSAGWIVTNQQVFTTAASVRGHTAKLRKVLNDIGVLTSYTFSVKGYQENRHNFATNARAVQEQIEEKKIGLVPKQYYHEIESLPQDVSNIVNNIRALRQKAGLPFLGTDRNVLNLPGVGKSLTFRTIGILEDGRRILEFDHDGYRQHSPIIDQMGKVIIIESKSIRDYLLQLAEIGEDLNEYESLYGYSIGVSEPRIPLYMYPEYNFKVTEELTNFEMLKPENREF